MPPNTLPLDTGILFYEPVEPIFTSDERIKPTRKVRPEILIGLIRQLGVPLKPNTKLSEEVLEERLQKCLKNCQAIDDLPSMFIPNSSPPLISIDALPKFTPEPGHTYEQEMRRYALSEMEQHKVRLEYDSDDEDFPSEHQASWDLRRIVRMVGSAFGSGEQYVAIQDYYRKSTICLRLIEARKAGKDTPLILVLYSHILKADSPSPSLNSPASRWLTTHSESGKLMRITTSLSAHHLLLRILSSNHDRLSLPLNRSRRANEEEADEEGFKFSFVLPVGPLEADAKLVLSLPAFDTCALCGVKASSACSRCKRVTYCSQEHQKQDWRTHKPACIPISSSKTKSGSSSWLPLRFASGPSASAYGVGLSGDKPMAFTSISLHNPLQGPQKRGTSRTSLNASNGPPPNTHGDSKTPFIIKIQVAGNTPMLIYDEERSFTVTAEQSQVRPDVWSRILETARKKGYIGRKIYVWARRKGDWELEIGLDNVPDQSDFLW